MLDIDKAVIRLKFYNLSSSEFIYATEFKALNFTLETDVNSVYGCEDTANETQCF